MPNVNLDQLLALLVSSGSPSVAADQLLALLVEQRFVPQIISTRVDQMLALIVERRQTHVVLTASSTIELANGSAQATITGTVLSPNNIPVAGTLLSLGQVGHSTISAPSGPSNAQGQVFWTVTDSTVETVTYATINLPSNSLSIQFEATRVDGTVYGPVGPVVSGAQVYVVVQPANTSTVPPTPLLIVYSDPLAQQPITQPLITSGLGSYDFYAGATLYTLVVNDGTNTQVYADQEIGKPSAVAHSLNWWVKSSQGPAVPGAQVFVLANNFPNIPTVLSQGTPAPQQQVFSDAAGLVPLSQPLITDGFGYVNSYVAAGVYTVAVYLQGTLEAVYPDQSVGGVYAGPVGRYDLWVRNALGVSAANARVIVSAQPCSIPGKLIPLFPTNLAAIFADPNGFVPIQQSLTYDAVGNPIIASLTADANGHVAFYSTPNTLLTVSVYSSQNVLMYSLPDQVI